MQFVPFVFLRSCTLSTLIIQIQRTESQAPAMYRAGYNKMAAMGEKNRVPIIMLGTP